MKFHFEFDIKALPAPLSHRQPVLLLGSCFTENMGEKLKQHKFRVLENPHGILFNPESVAGALCDIAARKQYTEAALFHYNEAWHSWQHHSRFSGLSAAEALGKINGSINGAHTFLQQSRHLLLTLGSAWVYTLTPQAANATPGMVAANNHKAPASWFERRLLSVDNVVARLDDALRKLRSLNPGLQVLFTISPVRHLREGVVDNNRSKAVLIQAVHQLVDTLPGCYYFPAYELVIDDLRDYRFYAEDLVHPNYHATQYVWEKFTQACMDSATRKLMEEIAALNRSYSHKPFNPDAAQHRKFLETSYARASQLQELHPYLDLAAELDYFRTGVKHG